MKNSELWQPTKFIYRNNKLVSSSNLNFVGISSRLVVNIVASFYEKHLKDHVSGNLIDLGCGRVPLYQSYKKHTTNIICADWENSNHKNPHLDVVCDLNQSLPFKNSEFRTIILSDVLEHIKNPTNLWIEMMRILEPGGKLILNVPFFYKLHEVPYDYYRYTRFALENFANNNSARIVLLEEIGGVPEILTDITAKNFTRIPLIGNLTARLLQASCKLFISTSIGK